MIYSFDDIDWCWNFWYVWLKVFRLLRYLTSNFEMIISCALRDLLRVNVERLNRVRNIFLNQNIVLLFHALTCNEKKNWRWKFRRFLNANRIEFSMMFSKRNVIVNCCATIADFIWFEILDRDSYEINCISTLVERCKSWWL